MATTQVNPVSDSSARAKSLADSALKNLASALEAGESETLKRYLAAMGRFHNYSFSNTMLIATQKPSATRVAGFNAWKDMNRFVRKGEKGIAILAPLVKKETNEETGERESKCFGFRAVYVFDVAQTDGEELPAFASASGDPADGVARLTAFAGNQGITVDYDASIAPAKGVSKGQSISLLPGQSAAEEFTTLAHEIAHELLHRGARRKETSKTVRETEAEAVAYVVGSAMGLDMSTASADYIRLYAGDAETLSESLTHIQKAATLMIDALQERAEIKEAA